MRRATRDASVVVGAGILLTSSPVLADARVALFADGGAGCEIAHQMTAELRSNGFEVVTVKSSSTGTATSLTRAAADAGALAAVRCEGWAGGTAVEVWVSGAGSVPEESRRLESHGPEAPATLALRVAELIRARLIRVGQAPEVVPVERGDVEPAREPAPPEPRFAVRAAASVLASPGAQGPAVAPALELGYRWAQGWWVELRAIGPGRSTASNVMSSTSVEEMMLLAGARRELTGDWLAPFAAVAAGAYRIATDGSAEPPLVARRDSAITAAFAAGAGVRVGARLTSRVRLDSAVRVDAVLLAPRPVIRLAEEVVSRPGRPLLAATVSLGGAF